MNITYCTFIVAFSQPFRVGVHFDSDETPLFDSATGAIITAVTAKLTSEYEEVMKAPGGIIGNE